MSLLRPFFALMLFGLVLPQAACRGEEAWLPLFDGKSLDGWKGNEHADQWKVEDGAIATAPTRSHLFYVGPDAEHPVEFQNFHLRAEVMTKDNSNSGVFFHTQFQQENWPSKGIECQVNATHPDPVKTGSLYNIVKNYVSPVGDNEWFTLEIIVKGHNAQTLVNGKILCDYTEPKGQITDGKKIDKGLIALQGHDPKSKVLYRKVEIQKLP
jgi:hypothetical protein